MKHSYKLVLSYDGTDYYGWQRQKEYRSIDGVVRKTFLRSFFQKDLLLVGASRTDAGVHARGQVIRIRTVLPLPAEKIIFVLNRALPQDIKVLSCESVDATFHPQRDVVRKTYSYTFSLEKLSPMETRYSWQFPHELSFERLKEALSIFIGTHDFRNFCREIEEKITVRTIEQIRIERSVCGKKCTIFITGPSFLRHMIRRIVGGALAVASSDTLSVIDLQKLLNGTFKCIKLMVTAPAQGLCLESIEYKPTKRMAAGI